MNSLQHIAVLLCASLLPLTGNAQEAEPLEVTYRQSFARKQPEQSYEYQVLNLALRKTEVKYGSYSIKTSAPMNPQRALIEARKNTVKNYIFRNNYSSEENYSGLTYIPISIDLGIFGYRVCFTSSKVLNKTPDITSLKQLLTMTMGQPQEWLDYKILRANNFHVYDIINIASMHKMVASNRFDYLCRGANELHNEWNNRKYIEGLTYDRSFALYYDLPRFFFTNENNVELKLRVQEGLNIAFEDGSLQKIWLRQYGKAIKFSQLENRILFYLENPYVKNISQEYQYYFMNPYQLQ